MTISTEITQGTQVSYSDMANPPRHGVVTGVATDPWSQFEITWEDGTVSTSDCRQPGWKVDELRVSFEARAYGRSFYGVGDAISWETHPGRVTDNEQAFDGLSPAQSRRVMLRLLAAWKAAFAAACAAKGALAA